MQELHLQSCGHRRTHESNKSCKRGCEGVSASGVVGTMTIEFSIASANLSKLILEYSPLGALSSEAQTRYSFIDKFLEECLGWPRSETIVEHHEQAGRTDYECGKPRALVLEAKLSADPFSLPPKRKTRMSIASLVQFNVEVSKAISQVQGYGQNRGIPVAVVSNASQLIAFLATRTDGVSPMKGDALVFDGYEEISRNFALVYEHLSKVGVEEKRLESLLSGAAPASLPQKISVNCLTYFEHKYSSQFQES